MKITKFILIVLNLFFVTNIGLSAPTISSVAIPNVAMKVGSSVTATITVTDDGGTTYTLVAGSTIGGFTLGGLSRTNNTSYTATFTVTNGGTDIAAGSNILVSLTLSDGANTTYSTPISQNADPIDANNPLSPTISGISVGIYNTNQIFTVSGEASATIEYSTNNGGLWTSYSGAVTLSAEGTYNVLTRQTDQAGNGPTASAVITLTIDKTVPAAPTILGISTGTFSTNQTFTVSGEAGATMEYSTNNGGLWTAYSGAVTISAEGTHNVLARQTDQAGNGPTTSAVITLVIDKTAPTAPTISGISAGYFNTNQIFTVSGEAGATIEYSTNNGGLWTAYSGAVTLSAEGIYNVFARQTDQAGNGPITTSSAITIIIDKTAPSAYTVAIDQAINNSNQTVLSFTFVGAEVGATYNYTISSTGGGTNKTGSGTIATATDVISGIDVSLLGDGTLTLSVTLTDPAGNVGSATTNTKLKDTSIPSTPSSPDLSSGTDSGTSNSDNITNASNPVFSGIAENSSTVKLYSSIDGLIGNTTANGTTGVWTITVSSITENVHSITVTATDAAGNTSSSSTDLSVTIDRSSPSIIDFSSTFSNPTNSRPIPVRVEFNEDVTGFASNDIDVAGSDGSIGKQNFSGGPRVFLFELTISGVTKSNITADINASKCTDIAGNPNNAATQFTITYDNDRPRILSIVASPSANPTNASTIDLTINFDENVTGFTQLDLVLTNCSASSFSGNNKTYGVTITPIADGLVKVEIPEDVCIDISSLYNRVANPFTTISDKTKPTLSFVSIVSNYTHTDKVKNGGIVTCSFIASEQIKNVAATIAGTSATIANVGGNSYTATITMPNKPDGLVSFSISFDDMANNGGNAVTTTTNGSSVTNDNSPPTLNPVTIISNNATTSRAKVGDIVALDFTSLEPIENVVVKFNGTKNPMLTNVSGNIWKAEYTMVSSDNSGIVTFTIDFKDYAGNSGTQVTGTTNSSSVLFDKVTPSLTSVNVASNNADPAYAKQSDLITLQFTASENIKIPTVTINGIAATSITGGPTVWTATRAIGAAENQGLLPFSITYADLSDNVGLGGNATTNGSKVIVDSQVPIISSVTVPGGVYKTGSLVTVSINVANAVDSKLLVGQTVLINGVALSLINMNDNSYTVNYTVQVSDLNRDAVSTLPVNIILKDPAGNLSAAATAATLSSGTSITIDTKPTYTITGFAERCEGSGTLPITFTFTGTQPFNFTYTKDGVAQAPASSTTNSYVINTTKGEYKITSLTDAYNSAIINPLEKAEIKENLKPAINFVLPSLNFAVNDPRYKLTLNVTPASLIGTYKFEGDGVGTDGYFYPALVGIENTVVTELITYTLTNAKGCTNTSDFEINVTSNTGSFSGFDSRYCKNSSAATSDIITVIGVGSTSGESFTLNPASSFTTTIDKTHFELNPKEMKAANYELIYNYTDVVSGSPRKISRYFTIDSISTLLNFTSLNANYCSNSNIIQLEAENIFSVTGSGTGHFEGPTTGFSTLPNNKAKIDPSLAPLDQDFDIKFYYDSDNGCISPTLTKTTRVNSLPVVDFTVRDNYNFEEAPITLVGNHSPEGTFSGEGVSLGKFYPNLARPDISIPITYSFTDTKGCTSSLPKVIKVYKADFPIGGLDKNNYCYKDITYDIDCYPKAGGIDYVGVFTNTKGRGLIPINGNKATYSLKDARSGKDTVKFSYSVNGTPYKVMKVVFIDSIGPITMDLKSSFCKNEDQVKINGVNRQLDGIRTYSIKGNLGNPDAFISNPLYATFTPEKANVGLYEIKYQFTTNGGCSDSIKKTIEVNPVAYAAFSISASCPSVNSAVSFINNTVEPALSDPKYAWNFADGITSTAKDTIIKYKFTGVKNVTLTAITNKNCKSTTPVLPVSIGVSPKADFMWNNECFGDLVTFTNSTTDGTIKTAIWKLNNVQTSTRIDTIIRKFELGEKEITLAIETNEGCTDEIKKTISIQPHIKFNVLPHTYYNDFETGTENWFARSIDNDTIKTKWTLGTPSGTIFTVAESGSKAWYTNVGLNNQKPENSQVISPCFDFRGLEKPMIKLNIWSAPEPGRDGAVLQYSTDGGQTWKTGSKENNVGAVGKGANWYDPGNISSKPGGQDYGWSSPDAQTGWKTARYNLDTLKGLTNVKFRIVYANEGRNIKPYNGFAFDDVWIGDRQQNVLTEYFTNSELTSCVASNSYMKNLEKRKKEDIISIHYHSGATLFNDYTAGPSSRMFYYGVSDIPSVFSNGVTSATLINANSKTEFETKIDAETLKDPKIAFDTLYASFGNVVLELKALKDLTGENLVLYIALVKDSIQTGGVYYYNVLRRFIPNPGGSLLSTNGWLNGQVAGYTIPLNVDNPAEFINAKLVAFVQNSNKNQIYQVASYQTSILTNDHPLDISNLVDVYPNPARDYLIIECENSIDKLMIFDITGRVVGSFTPSQARYSLPVQHMEGGIYIIKGSTKKGQFVRKFIKQ